jgi:DNA-binding transcriptional LysR family regulator
MGSLPNAPAHLTLERLLSVPMVMVASPRHPLGANGVPIAFDKLSQHVQLVLTDRSALSAGREFGVFSAKTWRIADLGAKESLRNNGIVCAAITPT